MSIRMHQQSLSMVLRDDLLRHCKALNHRDASNGQSLTAHGVDGKLFRVSIKDRLLRQALIIIDSGVAAE